MGIVRQDTCEVVDACPSEKMKKKHQNSCVIQKLYVSLQRERTKQAAIPTPHNAGEKQNNIIWKTKKKSDRKSETLTKT